MPNEKRSLKQSLEALHQYAESLGYWPSRPQWDKYAVENGYYTAMGFWGQTKKGWEVIREEMNIPPKEKRFTREECVQAIRIAADALGVFFTRREYGEWQKEVRPDLPTHMQISNRCRGWNGAKEEAGLLPNPATGKSFDDEQLIEALRLCEASVGSPFSEIDYDKWRNGNLDIPTTETIRKRFGGIPEAKQKLGMCYHDQGPQLQYFEGEWKAPMVAFVAEALSTKRYLEWMEKNDGPSTKTLRDHAGGYEKAILEAIRLYAQKVEAGRRRK